MGQYIKTINYDDCTCVYNSLFFEPVFLTNSDYRLLETSKDRLDKDICKRLEDKNVISSDVDNIQRINMMKNVDMESSGIIDVLYLVLSTECNLRCTYCMVKSGGYANTCMKQDVAFQAIDLYVKYLKQRNIFGKVIFYGGEPLLRKKLIKQLILYANKEYSNIRFEIVTNGTLIDDDITTFCKQNNVCIGISLDGPREINDINRKYSNKNDSVYLDVIKSIKRLRENNVIYGISMCFNLSAAEKIDELKKWILSEHISNLNINLLHYNEYKETWKGEYQLIINALFDMYDFILDNGLYEENLMRRINAFIRHEPIFASCAATGANQLSIFPDGHIGVCHVDRNDHTEYNVLDINDFNEIEDIELFEFWKNKMLKNRKNCLDCEALFICGAGCWNQADVLNESIDKSFCMYSRQFVIWFFKRIKNYEIRKQ